MVDKLLWNDVRCENLKSGADPGFGLTGGVASSPEWGGGGKIKKRFNGF